ADAGALQHAAPAAAGLADERGLALVGAGEGHRVALGQQLAQRLEEKAGALTAARLGDLDLADGGAVVPRPEQGPAAAGPGARGPDDALLGAEDLQGLAQAGLGQLAGHEHGDAAAAGEAPQLIARLPGEVADGLALLQHAGDGPGAALGAGE